ncbi:molybdopterin-dependent oxidoreductase [Aestuariicella hydrocarbonica]|uniref:Molybdopterin-dependent oxidoreductase n=1 Tax=Pseudomaricurvus hydrocarbonicus TaxID=1470433 RepID=A0A9E5JT83_9GAMM|nr:molybdopterin-dependent oxidoreductase [Aestuariicella hydrocarbonica]NHO66417.1 molybdopterin-dependent oxidoreductase [Aestuariicella hydrocarbonica]
MSDEIITHYRACHLCEAICGLEIKTQGAQVLSIKGDKEDPFSRGHICPKATALQDLHFDPDRLKHPVKRVGDGWQQISWEEAFDTVAENLVRVQQAGGNNAVALYSGNPNVHNYGSLTHGGILRKVLQTQNNYSATSLDQLPHQLISYAMYGHQSLIPIPDIDRTQYMLIIGGNPLASNGSIMTVPDVSKRLKAIQARGGKFVVIDPRRTETAAIADEHHFIRPGSDAFLLMAVIHTLFEENLVQPGHLAPVLDGLDEVKQAAAGFTAEMAAEQTGIDASAIRQMARDMAAAEGAVCYGRMGVSVQLYGSLCQWAIQVINILTGSLDVPGGALVTSPAFGYIKPGESGAGSFGRRHSRVKGLPEFSGEFPSSVLAEEILTPGEGQVRALVTRAGNPVLSAPNGNEMDRALESLDYMVAVDLYINETTRHADIILPPTGPLEHDHYDIAFHRLAVRNTTRYNEPVFEPEPDSRHDWEIFNELSARIAALKNIEFKPLPAPDQLLDLALQYGHYGKATGAQEALTLEKLKEYPHGLDLGPLQTGLAERLCTQDGRIHMNVEYLLADVERLRHNQTEWNADELLLIGRRHVRSNNSWMHNYQRLVKGKPRWQLLMHPDDLARHHLSDNSEVTIESRVGKVTTTVVASNEVMPGVVSLPHGWGHKRKGVQMGIAAEQQGVSCNDLTDEQRFDPVSGNAVLNGVPVKVFAADQ